MSLDIYPTPADVVLGTMATQNANAVTITGGTAILTGTSFIGDLLDFSAFPSIGVRCHIRYNRSTGNGLQIITNADSGPGVAVYLLNAAAGGVGSITTTATATAFNTASDIRLKRSIEKLVGALGVVQLLNPVSFLWKADNSPGVGFAAHELQQVIPDAVTGEFDAVNDDGSIRPQQVDLSKLVPWLVGATQELAARVQYLETQLGV